MACARQWSQEHIVAARAASFSAVLGHIGDYHKVDANYAPMYSGRRGKRIQVSFQKRDFRYVFTGERFVNGLLPDGAAHRGGSGAINFVRHVTSCNFVHAVKVCLDTLQGSNMK